MKKILVGSLIGLSLITSLQAGSDKIDEYVNNIVLEKDNKIIEQSKFDKEYLQYLLSLEKKGVDSKSTSDKKNTKNSNGFKSFGMTHF